MNTMWMISINYLQLYDLLCNSYGIKYFPFACTKISVPFWTYPCSLHFNNPFMKE